MTAPVRTGLGFDAHRLEDDGQIILAGVTVTESRGVAATSDGDVVAHAVADALLGAAGLGDIGMMFPSGDERWHDADSMEMLSAVVHRLVAQGHEVISVDLTVIAEHIRVSPHREAMRARLAATLGIDVSHVSVKATTTDGMGLIGQDEGIACMAIATVVEIPSGSMPNSNP